MFGQFRLIALYAYRFKALLFYMCSISFYGWPHFAVAPSKVVLAVEGGSLNPLIPEAPTVPPDPDPCAAAAFALLEAEVAATCGLAIVAGAAIGGGALGGGGIGGVLGDKKPIVVLPF